MAAKSMRDLSKGVRKPKTEQRTYRFNAQLWADFEKDCARHLRNPRLVIEALVRHWLDADDKDRSAIAQRHEEWSGGSDGEE
jgi:hypothetical protein